MKKVCIVGYGSIGRRHHKVLLDVLGYNAEFDIVDLNTDLSVEVCSKKTYDILVICTPSNNHIDILKNFKNVNDIVFIEKPLDSQIEKIRNFRNKKILEKVHVGCNLRFTEAYSDLSKLISDVVLLNVTSMSHLPSWRKNIDHRKNYSANKSMGGGVVLDFIHEPDYVFSLLGMPKFFKNTEKRLFQDVTVDSFDTASLHWEYPDKIVNINLSYGSKDYVRNAFCLMRSGETKEVEFKLDDINLSYERQWKYILKHGPVNTFNDAKDLLEILT